VQSDNPNAAQPRRSWFVAAVLAAAVVVGAAGALSHAAGPPRGGAAGAARSYVSAILRRDGTVVCRLADATTRSQLDKLAAQERREPSFRGPFDCAHVAAGTIGYPHENMGIRVVGGRILSVGRVRPVNAKGRHYTGVDVRVRFDLERTGYYTNSNRPPASVWTDTVWLRKNGTGWRTVKPSLTLQAAWFGDVLSMPWRVSAALSPPTR